jgi:putative membrane protein
MAGREPRGRTVPVSGAHRIAGRPKGMILLRREAVSAMDDKPEPSAPPELIKDDPAVELSSNRTSLSFERTRMSSDRTLMSTVRTSLSLISFGFTIYQVLGKASALIPRASELAQRLGLALLSLGLLLLVMGLVSHASFNRALSHRRARLYEAKLLRRALHYRMTPTYLAALMLLLIGVAALISILWRLSQ